MVGCPCHPWGRLGFDQWWYPLLHTEPSFLQKHIKNKKKQKNKKKYKKKNHKKKGKQKKTKIIRKEIIKKKNHQKKKKKLSKKKNFWTTWWLDPFRGYVGNLVSFCWVQSRIKKFYQKKKKKKLLNYVMTWSLSRLRRQLSIFLLSSVMH